MKIHRSKRLRFSIYVFHVFIFIGIFAIVKNYNLSDLAVYMSATAIPLVAYVLGDTFRKSEDK